LTTPKSGNRQTSHNLFLQFWNDQIVENLFSQKVENLNVVGISLGNNFESISTSVTCVREIELDRLQEVLEEDKINSVF
jgi:hypothetical protein